MVRTNNNADLTEQMLRYCYTCDNARECNEEMIVACMKERRAELGLDPEQAKTRELLRLYEQ